MNLIGTQLRTEIRDQNMQTRGIKATRAHAYRRLDNRDVMQLIRAAKQTALEDVEYPYEVLTTEGRYFFFDLSGIYRGRRFIFDLRREYQKTRGQPRAVKLMEDKQEWASSADVSLFILDRWKGTTAYRVMINAEFMRWDMDHRG